jgi:hypothetical protein
LVKRYWGPGSAATIGFAEVPAVRGLAPNPVDVLEEGERLKPLRRLRFNEKRRPLCELVRGLDVVIEKDGLSCYGEVKQSIFSPVTFKSVSKSTECYVDGAIVSCASYERNEPTKVFAVISGELVPFVSPDLATRMYRRAGELASVEESEAKASGRITAATSNSSRAASCSSQLAMFTSVPFSLVRITFANRGPPGGGFANGIVSGLVRKWPRCTVTHGSVLRARR